MRVTSARPKPMPIPKPSRERWVSAVVWLLFCAAMVAVALFLTPRIGAAYASDDLTIPDEVAAPTLASTDDGHAVSMAATVLYPNEAVAVVKH
ncbi:hypothetical protein [Rhodoferax sp.]|uniref:hypothetical protein n=1 Tax=Rhodoferax sp. TaxID=50421 RepID=UPI0025D9142A|nr:hypothetical protein [Rhodoferax sp.]